MNETIKQSHESHERHVPQQEHGPKTHEKGPEAAPEANRHLHQENLAHLRQKAENEAKSARETLSEQEPAASHTPKEAFINRELKDMAYNRTMNRVRQQLSPVGRSFSKFVHQPVVNAVSDVAAKTVGRPSGLFGGGLLALTGTSVYYFITKHYGYDYNFMVFLLLLAAGFIAGWVFELLWRLLHPSK